MGFAAGVAGSHVSSRSLEAWLRLVSLPRRDFHQGLLQSVGLSGSRAR